MRPDQLEHVCRTLVGHEPEVHPGTRVRRQNGFHTRPAVARVDAADVAGGGERQPFPERHPRQVVDEPLDAEELAQLVLDARALLGDRLSRTLARLADGILKSLHAHTSVRCADARQGGMQTPGRAGENCGSARVRIDGESLDVELDREVALEPEGDLGPAVEGEAAAFPEASVGLQQLGVTLDDCVEVRARDLLLALDDPADRHRQRAAGLAKGTDRRKPDADLGLVVGSTARIEPAVTQRRFERRRLPELDRVDWLDIVVVVEEQSGVAFTCELPVHGRRSAVDLELPSLEPRGGQQSLDELGRLVERPVLGGHARLATKLPRQIERLLLDRPHVE